MRKRAELLGVLVLVVALLGAGALDGQVLAGAAGLRTDLSAYPWVFLRDGQAVRGGEALVELVAVGDVMLGRGAAGEPDPFGETANLLSAADLALGNLEGPISPRTVVENRDGTDPSSGGPYRLVAGSDAVEKLRTAGFDLLGVANNHALDMGFTGLTDTAAQLQTAGMLPVGAGDSLEAAYRPLTREVQGIRLAFLAFNAVPIPAGPEWTGEVIQGRTEGGWRLAAWDGDRSLKAVRQARQEADAVIVFMHWGYEYDLRPDPAQRQIAAALMAAGADLVLGHHPHVAQPFERVSGVNGRTGLIAYSLGNFVFDQGQDETGRGLALRIFFDAQGLRAVQVLPVQAGLRPAFLSQESARPLLERVLPESTALAQASRESEIFTSGWVDLTGDGRDEQVWLENGRIQVAEAGDLAWSSPAEWRVVDLATGDPNRDGRQELMLAVDKPDANGVLLSHPYVVGHREGQYRLLWGGSAVSAPIVDVDLQDVDGDGSQELVVLEAPRSGEKPTRAIWRWHGWGFSLVEREPISE